MSTVRLCLTITAALLTIMPASAQSVSYEMVPVGDPGNINDTINTGTNPNYGAVPYAYQIGKYEVTIGQYAAFLNAVAKTDTYLLYAMEMDTDRSIAGIVRSGSSGSYTYSVTGPSGTAPPGANSPGNRPILYVSWFDSARFANWMSNGQPTGLQGPTTTENGAYDLSNWSSGTAPAMNVTNPNTGSTPLYRIPTENEWYKAAYYKGGGTTSGYWSYATQSNTTPGNTIGGGSNQANWFAGTHAVTQSSIYFMNQNYLTNVGAFTNSQSPYGTFDQSGNVLEWNDLTGTAGSSRGLRGGTFGNNGTASLLILSSGGRITQNPAIGFYGFRLASPIPIPEPSTYIMALAGIACGGYSMFRRRRQA